MARLFLSSQRCWTKPAARLFLKRSEDLWLRQSWRGYALLASLAFWAGYRFWH